MPNWCANHIEISGPTNKIKDLYEKTCITGRQTTEQGSEVGFLEYLAPLGEWNYHDALSTWGTKWEVDAELDFNYTDNGAVLTGYFDSAWSPPVQACETFMIHNPDCDVQLHYYEPAMDFCGDLNNHITISDEGKDFFCNDPVGQELDGHFGIIDMIEEEEEYQQDEVLATPPDVMEGTEFEEDV